MTHTLASLFTGVGGFDIAALDNGITPILMCENDPAAQSVLRERFPDVSLWGDATTLDGSAGPVDIITAGSPCQDFSIAGLRAGLAGERSGLFDHVIRLRDELQARFVVWENVPGALTSKKGEDFANVIGALVGSSVPLPLPLHPTNKRRSRYAGIAHGPKGTLAWRVLDAQHFGVPQRRQRIFAVLDTQGWDSIRVLFPDYSPQNSRPWVVRGNSWAQPLDYDDLPFDTGMTPPAVVTSRLSDVLEDEVDGRFFLSVKACKGILRRAGNRGRVLPAALDHALRSQAGEKVDLAPTAEGVPSTGACREAGTGQRYDAETETLVPVLMKMREGKPGGGKGPLLAEDRSLTVETGNTQTLFAPQGIAENQRGEMVATDYAHAVTSGGGKPGQGYPAALVPAYGLNATQDPISLAERALPLESRNGSYSGAKDTAPLYRVRRLTTVECERLQGFPDGHTAVNGAKDTNRYRQMGNAVAVPVASWVLSRIAAVLS